MHTSRGRKGTNKSPQKVKRSGTLSQLVTEIGTLSRAKPASSTTLNNILQRLQALLGADAVTLYQYDPLHQQLSELASIGGRVELVGFLAIGEGKGLTGWAALHKRPLLLKNRSVNLSFDPDRDFASFLAAPLPLGSAPLGLLAIGSRRPNGLTVKDSDNVLKLIDPLSIALERYLFCKRLEAATKEVDRLNRQLSDSTVHLAASKEFGSVASRMLSLNHEINEALSVVLGHLQCMAETCAMANQKELSRLRRMEEAALRIRSVNQALLRLARVGQMKQPAGAGK